MNKSILRAYLKMVFSYARSNLDDLNENFRPESDGDVVQVGALVLPELSEEDLADVERAVDAHLLGAAPDAVPPPPEPPPTPEWLRRGNWVLLTQPFDCPGYRGRLAAGSTGQVLGKTEAGDVCVYFPQHEFKVLIEEKYLKPHNVGDLSQPEPVKPWVSVGDEVITTRPLSQVGDGGYKLSAGVWGTVVGVSTADRLAWVTFPSRYPNHLLQITVTPDEVKPV